MCSVTPLEAAPTAAVNPVVDCGHPNSDVMPFKHKQPYCKAELRKLYYVELPFSCLHHEFMVLLIVSFAL